MAAPMRSSARRFFASTVCRRLSVRTPFHNDNVVEPQPIGQEKTAKRLAGEDQEFVDIRTAYTDVQRKKIMSVINEENLDQFLRYEVSKTLAVSIIRNRNSKEVGGRFRNFNHMIVRTRSSDFDMLHVLCDSIVYGLSTDGRNQQSMRWRLCYPNVPEDLARELNSLVLLQLHSDGASWLHLGRDRKILDWQYWPLKNLDKVRENRECLRLARSVVDKLAVADAYLMDHRVLTSRHLPSTPLVLNNVRIECMIAAMLYQRSSTTNVNENQRVFFLKNDVVCSYFRLRVGNEQVSGQNLIDDLLSGYSTKDTLRYHNLQRAYADETTRLWYRKQPLVIKEHLTNALLKAIAFYQLEVAKIPVHAIGRIL